MDIIDNVATRQELQKLVNTTSKKKVGKSTKRQAKKDPSSTDNSMSSKSNASFVQGMSKDEKSIQKQRQLTIIDNNLDDDMVFQPSNKHRDKGLKSNLILNRGPSCAWRHDYKLLSFFCEDFRRSKFQGFT